MMDLAADLAVEAIVRDELARESRAVSSVVPVLRHLLGSEAQALVSDAILARVRGMIIDLANQLLAAQAGRDPTIRAANSDPVALDQLAETLMANEALLGHCHALGAESLIAERLQQRGAIDPVLSPLLQELIAAEDGNVAALAMSTLAAQSRFMQAQRRMELPLGELPAELFHGLVAETPIDTTGRAGLARLQQEYDEGTSRLGLLARLVATIRRGALAALELEHAGIALFASALSMTARTARTATVLACLDGQGMRFALLLRAAGISPPAITRQLLLVEPAGHLPIELAALAPDRAAELLGPEAVW